MTWVGTCGTFEHPDVDFFEIFDPPSRMAMLRCCWQPRWKKPEERTRTGPRARQAADLSHNLAVIHFCNLILDIR